MEERRVEINICSPHQPVRAISAKLSGYVSALQVLFPSQKKVFIFNGSFLDENSTFAETGLVDGDSIIALGSKDEKYQWLNLTKDRDEFSDMVRTMLDPRTANEAARIRDLHMMRIEGKPRVFSKLSKIDYSKSWGDRKSQYGNCSQYNFGGFNTSNTDSSYDDGYNYNNSGLDINGNINVSINNEYAMADAPSTEALPVLW
ncbi:hypothetical protein TRFO_34849 [Tritrichomonas foetus]|uniref:Ubiquitin-like domain-containing protein n=1 Tax=Tritrichomonas foetus TaxID=1144522 RepID=A0A1J4JJY0_9EUKA|nr:hypothetical protein TRFO_34849 [Tritrichomonas foetus]|eukprot:OHS98671.1 hypothetical protein TRFO_34849 [Tritrichomonas foetus]